MSTLAIILIIQVVFTALLWGWCIRRDNKRRNNGFGWPDHTPNQESQLAANKIDTWRGA